jgi:hypothetical protein
MAVDETPVSTGSPTEVPPAVALHRLVNGVFVAQAISVFARLGVADALVVRRCIGCCERSVMSESSRRWRVDCSP